MPDFDPAEPRPILTRAYFRGLLGGAGALAIYCLLNVLADPGGEFGLSGRFLFNRAPPSAAIARGQARGNPTFYARIIRETPAKIFLIGPSRTERGFDICGQPDILRITGDAWGLSRLSQAQALVLDSRKQPATLLVEIGLPQDEPSRIAAGPDNLVSAALSPENALWSVQTIAASLASRPPAPAYTRCTPRPSGQHDWDAALKSLRASQKFIYASPDSLRRGRDNLMAMADEADRICARTGVPHRVIYFSLPATPSQSPGWKLDELIKINSEELAVRFAHRAKAPNGCTIRYLNFTRVPPGDGAEQLLWRDRDQWSDYVHYSPRLGSIALRALLAAGNGPGNSPPRANLPARN